MKLTHLTFNNVLKSISEHYSFNRNHLASILNCNISMIGFYLNNKRPVSYEKAILLKKEIEKIGDDIYSFIFKNNNVSYFHGSRGGITFPIIATYSKKKTTDFGKGFYIGETFMQSSTLISTSNIKNSRVYSFDINFDGLKVLDITPKSNNDYRWILTIALYRDYIKESEYPELYKSIKEMLNNYDAIKGPIADDRMTTAMDKFFANKITDIQLSKCLQRMNLGNQYCFLNDDACKHINVLEEISFDKTTISLINDYEKEHHLEAVNYTDQLTNSEYKIGKLYNQLLLDLRRNKWNLLLK